MANHPSAERRNRQRIRRTSRNRAVKSAVRGGVKKAHAAIQSGAAEAAAVLRTVESELDKAAQKGVIHRRTAARKKARLKKHLSANAKKA